MYILQIGFVGGLSFRNNENYEGSFMFSKLQKLRPLHLMLNLT